MNELEIAHEEIKYLRGYINELNGTLSKHREEIIRLIDRNTAKGQDRKETGANTYLAQKTCKC